MIEILEKTEAGKKSGQTKLELDVGFIDPLDFLYKSVFIVKFFDFSLILIYVQ